MRRHSLFMIETKAMIVAKILRCAFLRWWS